MISYDPLLDFLHFNKKNITDIGKELGLSPRTLAKFRKGEPLSLTTIERICLFYDLRIEEVVEIIPEPTDEQE